MIVLAVEEFAAKRRTDQEDLEKDLYPHVAQSIEEYPAQTWADDLVREVARTYLDVFHREGGTGLPTPSARSFTAEIKATLDKTKDPTQATVDRISIWLATAILNAGTLAAAADDEEFLLMEWVTMHDGDVRVEHQETEGQQRPTTEAFDVAGTPMRYPGDPTAPIELWINCRCTLAPVLGSDAQFQKTEGVTMTATESEVETTVADGPLAWHGILAPEGKWSGDGRQFAPESLRFRDLPLPLTWQKATDSGHDGSIVVGKIDVITRNNGMMEASGTFLRTPEADEVIGLLAEFGKFGVSVDADDAEFEFSETDERITFTSARIASASIVSIPAFAEAYITLGAADPQGTPVEEVDYCDEMSPDYDLAKCTEQKNADTSEPEFTETVDTFKDLAPGKTEDGPGWLTHPVDTDRLRDYWTHGEGAAKIGWGTPGDFDRCRTNLAKYVKPQYLNGYCANRHYDATGFWPGNAPSEQLSTTSNHWFTTLTTTTTAPALTLVSSGGLKAPTAWFSNPGLSGPTHLTVTDEGRVFGHIAEWKTCHIGYEGVCVAPPHSNSDYAYFASGSVLLEDGTSARTGVISLGKGHARDGLRPRAAIEHYDSTSAAVADVAVGEDDHGIWCAGWVRPGTTEEQIVALRASDVSGDWREVNGQLDMVAALAVNVGGFPTVSVGVRDGLQVSLVAAGAIVTDTDQVLEDLAEQIEVKMAERASRRVKMQELATRQHRRDRMKALAMRVEGGN